MTYDLATDRIQATTRWPGTPFGISVAPSGGYLLLRSELGAGMSRPRLARLDLATGRVHDLAAAWTGAERARQIAW